MRSQSGKVSSSLAMGNNQSSELSAAFGSGAALAWAVLEPEFVWALSRPGALLKPGKRSSNRIFVLIAEDVRSLSTVANG
jgi:hypothetical protein